MLSHMLILVLWFFYSATNLAIIVGMLAISPRIRRLEYIVAGAAAVSLIVSIWIYLFYPLPLASKTLGVQAVAYLFKFLASLFWGVLIWLAARFWRTRATG